MGAIHATVRPDFSNTKTVRLQQLATGIHVRDVTNLTGTGTATGSLDVPQKANPWLSDFRNLPVGT